MKTVALCFFMALVTVALLMPVAETSAAPVALQTNCDDDLCLYPLQVSSTVPDTSITCTGASGELDVSGTIGTGSRGCGFWFNLLNLPFNQRQYVTGDSLSPGVIGYRVTVMTYTNTGTNMWLGLPGPAANGSGATILNSNIGDGILAIYPKTYCRYWGSSSSFVNYDGECDNTDRISFSAPTDFYNMWAMLMQGHSSNPTGTWEAEFDWVVRGEPACQTDLEWRFDSSLEEWSALHYARSSTVGHDDPGSLWYLGTGGNTHTQLTAVELQTKLGTSGLIESDDVALSFWYKGQVDGITNNGIQGVIYYTNGGFDTVNVTATNSWQQAGITADDGKYISTIRLFALQDTNAELQHWIDDIVLSVPCANYTPDGTPTPTTPPPTGTPAPTATPPPPTPIPNPGGDPIPLPGTGPVSGCYRCEKPARLSISFFGQWITYLACVIWNIFSCSVRIWFMNVVNSVLGVWQSLRGLIMWLPTGLQYIMDWTAGLAGDFLNYLLSFWDKFRAAFTNIPRRLVEMIIQSEPVQAVWRFATWLEGLWLVIKATFQAVLSVIRNVYEGVVGFIHMLIGLANAVRQAWATPAYEIDFIPGEGGAGEGFSQPELLESGPNNTKIYWLIITAMAAFDTVLAGFGLEYIQFIAIGILSLIVIAWTLNQWRDILPI